MSTVHYARSTAKGLNAGATVGIPPPTGYIEPRSPIVVVNGEGFWPGNGARGSGWTLICTRVSGVGSTMVTSVWGAVVVGAGGGGATGTSASDVSTAEVVTGGGGNGAGVTRRRWCACRRCRRCGGRTHRGVYRLDGFGPQQQHDDRDGRCRCREEYRPKGQLCSTSSTAASRRRTAHQAQAAPRRLSVIDGLTVVDAHFSLDPIGRLEQVVEPAGGVLPTHLAMVGVASGVGGIRGYLPQATSWHNSSDHARGGGKRHEEDPTG